MKKILLTFTLLFSFSITLYPVLETSSSFINKYFTEYDNDLDFYYYNLNKYNTLEFRAMDKRGSTDYWIDIQINIEKPLYDLLDIRFYNNNYMFIVYDVSEQNIRNETFYISLVGFGTHSFNNNALNKVIQTLKEGNITMEYTTLNGSYKYDIDDKTANILAEILLYSSQN